MVPWFIGALILYAVSGRLYREGGRTVPEILGRRYGSPAIQVLSGLAIVACYIFYLVIQIKGFGIAAASLLNIDYTVAVFLVYLFILYSTFGGFYSVVKTDVLNLILLTVSMGVIYYVIIHRAGGTFLFTAAMVRESSAAAGIPVGHGGGTVLEAAPIYISSFFGWGMGLAANPQYMVRVMSAKSAAAARRMLVYSLIFLAAFYFAMTQIGMGLKALFPGIVGAVENDDVLVLAINQLLYSPLSGFFLISIIGACISTANSQLLLIGSSMSYDVIYQLAGRKMDEGRVLMLAKLFIFVGGTVSLLFSLNPPADTLSYGGDIWGVFAVLFTPLIYGGLLFKRGTRLGALSSVAAGALGGALFYPLHMEIYWAFPAVICSTSAFVLVSLWDRRRGGGSHEA